MDRSSCRRNAYNRNIRGQARTPARASESDATRSVAPGGTTTRTDRVPLGAQPAANSMSPSASRREPRPGPRRSSAITGATARQRMLQEHGRGERVHVTSPSAHLSAELVYCTSRRSRGEALVHESHGKPCSLVELAGHEAHLGSTWCLVPV